MCVVGVLGAVPACWARNVYTPPIMWVSVIFLLNAYGSVFILSSTAVSTRAIWTEVVMGLTLSAGLASASIVAVAAVVFPSLASREVG